MATNYTSGSIHFSGLGSETDFDTMITQLKQLEAHQKNRFTLWQADWNKRIEAFQKLNKSMLGLNSSLNSMNTMSKFLLKTALSSKPDTMTATAKGEAPNGTQKIEVSRMASNCSYTYSGHKFASTSEKVNPTNTTQNFLYTYKGKSIKVAVGANATISQLIKQINSDANNPGVYASLVKNGSEYLFQLQGKDTGESSTLTISPQSSQNLIIKPPSSTASGWEGYKPIQSLVSETRFSSENAVVNLTDVDQTFKFTYGGSSHSVAIGSGKTLKEMADAINNDCPDVQALVLKDGSKGYYIQITGLNPNITDPAQAPTIAQDSSSQLAVAPTPAIPGPAWDAPKAGINFVSNNRQFTSPTNIVNNTGSTQKFVFNFKGTKHEVEVASGATLEDMAQSINTYIGTRPDLSNLNADIMCTGKDSYLLRLNNTNSSDKNLPSIDLSTSPALGLNYTGSWDTKNTTIKYSLPFNSGSSVINDSGSTKQFLVNINDTEHTINLAHGATLDDLVSAINDPGAAGPGAAALIKDEGKYYLTIKGTSKAPTISSNSSKDLHVGPGSWSTASKTLTFNPTISGDSSVINSSGTAQKFVYTYNGETRYIDVPNGMTITGLVTAINTNPNVTAAYDSDTKKFSITGLNPNLKDPPMIHDSSSHALLFTPPTGWGNAVDAKTNTLGKKFTSPNDVINETATHKAFSYNYAGEKYTIFLAPNDTLQDLVDKINANSKSPAVMAIIEKNGSDYQFKFIGLDRTKNAPEVSQESSRELNITPPDARYKKQDVPAATFIGAYFENGSKLINTSGAEQTMILEYNGKTYKIKVANDTTLDQLVKQINDDDSIPIRANLLTTDDGKTQFQIWGTTLGITTPAQLSINSSDKLAIKPPDIGEDWFVQQDENTLINTSGEEQTMILDYNGVPYTIKVANGTTLGQLVQQINDDDSIPIRANLVDTVDGKKQFQIWGTTLGITTPAQLSINSSDKLAIKPSNAGKSWFVQKNCNALLKLNDWPEDVYDKTDPLNPILKEKKWLESETNSPDELIEGLTINFKEPGTAQITVTTDSSGIKEQIVALVDALNTVRTLIKEVSGVDSTKKTTNIGEASSQFDAQMGSILTGNYGVQLLSSKLKSATASQAHGFEYYRKDPDGLIHGDLFTSLAHVGITTVAEKNSPNFGLLTIDETKLDEALKQDPQSVAELFAADNIADCDSSEFSFASYVSGTTKPGVYKVEYHIDPEGKVTGTIGGHKASYDSETGQFTALEGPAKGMAVQINNKTTGDYEGTITIKMGKVGELSALTEELNGKDGILSILEKNYSQISKNIQKKIDKEDERLITWERTMRNKFARLEKVLARYNGLNKQLESAIKQLGSNKK